MKEKLWHSKDLYAGLMFISFGLVAMGVARNYSIGTAARMGPGYLPLTLGGIIVLLGLAISVRPLWLSGTPVSSLAIRSLLFVTAAVLAFGFLLRPFGLVVATLALVIIARLGDREFRVHEVTLLAVFLAAVAVGLFVYGLRLPLNVWPG